eukprot:CAMPEP_0206159980 /NCGR_PEP_ID=MMETSP1474-20131121/6348_1 /ASSEMBLY_ACC=CAM_ASM_001110 /TAXON_ID=97495 /ORGANISM="Imantonia sp., Strain RCC918" /LENGTH=158 /DNA_ID=CAMNT_0053561033 /DNA_START=83 /DNA_END=556 /DNA_ORIENTATION=-
MVTWMGEREVRPPNKCASHGYNRADTEAAGTNIEDPAATEDGAAYDASSKYRTKRLKGESIRASFVKLEPDEHGRPRRARACGAAATTAAGACAGIATTLLVLALSAHVFGKVAARSDTRSSRTPHPAASHASHTKAENERPFPRPSSPLSFPPPPPL